MIGGRTGRPLAKSTGPGTPSPVAQTASRSWPEAARSASKWASTSVSTSSGPSAIGSSTARDAMRTPARSATASVPWVAPRSAPRITPARGLNANRRGGRPPVEGADSTTTSRWCISCSRRCPSVARLKPVTSTSSERVVARRERMCWSTCPAEADANRAWLDTSFGHGAHSNRRDLRCQAQKYVLTMEKVFRRVRPVCRRNSGWRSSGWASWAARTHAPPGSPAPGSSGSRRRHRSGPRRPRPAWALIGRSRAPRRW